MVGIWGAVESQAKSLEWWRMGTNGLVVPKIKLINVLEFCQQSNMTKPIFYFCWSHVLWGSWVVTYCKFIMYCYSNVFNINITHCQNWENESCVLAPAFRPSQLWCCLGALALARLQPQSKHCFAEMLPPQFGQLRWPCEHRPCAYVMLCAFCARIISTTDLDGFCNHLGVLVLSLAVALAQPGHQCIPVQWTLHTRPGR